MNKEVKRGVQKAVEVSLDKLVATYGYPFVAPLLAVRDVVTIVKEEQFRENIKAFFTEAHSISEHDKVKFHQAIGGDVNKFYKRLIISLEEMDDERKAVIAGKLFKALIYGQLDEVKFRKLVIALNSLLHEDLMIFKRIFHDDRSRTEYFQEKHYQSEVENEHVFTTLESSGLIFKPEKQAGTIQVDKYLITLIGELLLKNGL